MRRAVASLLIVVSAAWLAACGGSGTATVKRAGCGQFCQQGSPQGTPGGAVDVRVDTSGAVLVQPDGIAPLTLTCTSSTPCNKGAVLLEGPTNFSHQSLSEDCAPGDHCMGKSDLVVAAHKTQTIGVPLSPTGLQLLRTEFRASVTVIIETPSGLKFGPRRITLTLNRQPPAGSFIVGESPSGIAVGQGGVWVARPNDNSVTRLDAGSGKVIDKVGAGPGAMQLVLGGGTLWVGTTSPNASDRGAITRIDTTSARVVGQPISVNDEQPKTMALGTGGLWVGLPSGGIARVDTSSGQAVGRPIPVSKFVPDSIAVEGASVWVGIGDQVIRIDAASGRRVGQPVSVGNGTYTLAAGDGVVWVANSGTNAVSRIDATTGKLIGAPIKVGHQPDAMAVDSSGVWVANEDDNSVTKIDPRAGTVVGGPIPVGLVPDAIAVAQGSVWVVNGGADTVTRIDAATGKVKR